MEFTEASLPPGVEQQQPLPYDMLTVGAIESVHAQFERSELPELPSGYRVVIDHRPAGHEDDYLSAEEYAAYISRREIPVAAPGTRLHTHDRGHVAVNTLLLRHTPVADLISTAASRALATGRTQEFLVFDTLGDNMGILYEFDQYDIPDATFGIEVVEGVRGALDALARLSSDDPAEQAEAFTTSWHALQLDARLLTILRQSKSAQ